MPSPRPRPPSSWGLREEHRGLGQQLCPHSLLSVLSGHLFPGPSPLQLLPCPSAPFSPQCHLHRRLPAHPRQQLPLPPSPLIILEAPWFPLTRSPLSQWDAGPEPRNLSHLTLAESRALSTAPNLGPGLGRWNHGRQQSRRATRPSRQQGQVRMTPNLPRSTGLPHSGTIRG